jgi:hypothetical protein
LRGLNRLPSVSGLSSSTRVNWVVIESAPAREWVG